MQPFCVLVPFYTCEVAVTDRDDEFSAFVAARSSSLLRTARLLTSDLAAAEDLLQTALAKLYVAWRRVGKDGAERYLRRCLVTGAVDASRRPWRRERTTEHVPDRSHESPDVTALPDRLLLLDALRQLPSQQRAAVVLRYYLDVPIVEAAALLHCSEGTVKSNASRGLVQLRQVLHETGGAV